MAKIWTGPIDTVTIPNGAQVSNEFTMPQKALGVLIFMPATLTQASLKLVALKPKLDDKEADVWQDVSTILTGAAAVTQSTVSGLTAAKAYGFDAGVLGAGVFRFDAGGNEGAAREIRLAWRVDGGA